jgi:nitrate/TMAO reductase-like tetraheme cytochrome c subunit
VFAAHLKKGGRKVRHGPSLAAAIIVFFVALAIAYSSHEFADPAPTQNVFAQALSTPAALPDFQYDPAEYWASRILTWTLLASILLVCYALFRVHRGKVDGAAAKGLLVVTIVLLPMFCVSTGMVLVFTRAERVEFCGSCHRALEAYVGEMKNPRSEGLAAIHYRYQYIASNQCYECHTSYGLFGTVKAKVHGVKQVLRYYTNTYESPLKMWQPYPNEDCLKCHAQSVKWLSVEEHVAPEWREGLLAAEASCMDCHEDGHGDGIAATSGELSRSLP